MSNYVKLINSYISKLDKDELYSKTFMLYILESLEKGTTGNSINRKLFNALINFKNTKIRSEILKRYIKNRVEHGKDRVVIFSEKGEINISTVKYESNTFYNLACFQIEECKIVKDLIKQNHVSFSCIL